MSTVPGEADYWKQLIHSLTNDFGDFKDILRDGATRSRVLRKRKPVHGSNGIKICNT